MPVILLFLAFSDTGFLPMPYILYYCGECGIRTRTTLWSRDFKSLVATITPKPHRASSAVIFLLNALLLTFYVPGLFLVHLCSSTSLSSNLVCDNSSFPYCRSRRIRTSNPLRLALLCLPLHSRSSSIHTHF